MSKQEALTNAQLLDLVEQALTLPQAQRYAWLKANSKPEVLADARRLLDLASSATGQTWSSPAELPSPGALEGRQIGPFKIDRLVGEGGMGQVFLATRNDGQFEQTVAIKLVRVAGMHTAISAQFEIERQILANLQHPNIAALLDGGTTPDGLHYVVMEYVDGASLGDYLREHSPRLDETLQLFVKICRAVESAHRALVIHRDIKPGNILVTADGEPKLLDFGIAKVLPAGQTATDSKQTILGALTPAYASPEQIRGEALTTACDVYALGVVLYEALVGARPHDTSNLTPAQTERTLSETLPQPPSQRAARNSAALRGDVDAILLKALAPETKRRYGTAGALADDLERYLSGQPVTAQADSGWYRLRKLVSRNRIASAALGFTTLAIVAGLIVSLWQAGVAREQRSLAVAQLDRAEAVSEFLGDILLSPSANWDSALQTGANATISDVLDVAERKLDSDLLDQPATRVELLNLISEARLWMEQPARAVQTSRASVAIAAEALTPNAPQRAVAHYRLGSALVEALQLEEGIAEFEASMQVSRNNGTVGDLAWLYVLHDRAHAHSELGQHDVSLGLQEEALAGMHALFGDEVLPTWPIAYNNLAMYQFLEGDLEAAQKSYARALLGYEAFPEQNLLTGVTSLNNLGLLLSLSGQMDASAAAHERALSLVSPLVEKGVGDETYALIVVGLAAPYAALGKADQAVALLEEVRAAIGDARLEAYPDVWSYYLARAQCAVALGDFEAAAGWADRAKSGATESTNTRAVPQHAFTAALAHAGAGHPNRAREEAAVSLAAFEAWLGGDHPVLSRARSELAQAMTTP